jgi:hypothetical protein
VDPVVRAMADPAGAVEDVALGLLRDLGTALAETAPWWRRRRARGRAAAIGATSMKARVTVTQQARDRGRINLDMAEECARDATDTYHDTGDADLRAALTLSGQVAWRQWRQTDRSGQCANRGIASWRPPARRAETPPARRPDTIGQDESWQRRHQC